VAIAAAVISGNTIPHIVVVRRTETDQLRIDSVEQRAVILYKTASALRKGTSVGKAATSEATTAEVSVIVVASAIAVIVVALAIADESVIEAVPEIVVELVIAAELGIAVVLATAATSRIEADLE
jgi:hypothetical protein